MNDWQDIEDLLRQAQAGDRRSLELLLAWLREQIKPRAHRLLQHCRVTRMDASDVAQEVCIRVHRAFDRLHEPCAVGQLLAWTHKILQNFVISSQRRPRREEA